MPADRSYGEILRNARERGGYDIVGMARALHIRPDILKAIEASDFSRMPAKGYSKNMIRAYARELGLDEKAVTNMYLDEAHLFETGRSRSSSRSGFPSARQEGRERRPSRGRAVSQELPRTAHRQQRGLAPGGGGEAPSRNRKMNGRSRKERYDQLDKVDPRGRDDRGSNEDRGARKKKRGQAVGAMGALFASGRSLGPGRGQKIPSSYNMLDSHGAYDSASSYGRSGNRGQGRVGTQMNLPLLILIVLAVIIVLIILIVLFNSGQQKVEDVPDIPISGLTDTSTPEGDPAVPVVSAAPTSATFTVEVADGEKSWIEITENGEDDPLLSKVVHGPYNETFNVTGTLTFKTANPDPVTLTLDGEPVKAKKGSSSQYYTYTVDFNAILSAWREEHEPDSSASGNSASTLGNASSSSGGSASSSSSSSSASSSSKSSSGRGA